MSAASSLARGFIISIMNPLITFIVATEPIDVGTSAAERGLTSSMDRYTDAVRRSGWCRTVVGTSMVAAEYGSPPEIAGTPAPGSAFMILARPLAVH